MSLNSVPPWTVLIQDLKLFFLREQCHEDFAVLGQFRAKNITLKWYYDQKIISLFFPILKAYSLNIQLAKF